MDLINNKLCRICGELKTFDQFYKRALNKDGFRNECKECGSSEVGKYFKTENGKAIMRKLRLKYPEKYKARWKLRDAIKTGKVKKQPCEICGSIKAEGHHSDYSQPLKVQWLCKKHHRIKEKEKYNLAF